MSNSILVGAHLTEVDLSSTNIQNCTGNSHQVKSMAITRSFNVTYTKTHITIGEVKKTLAEWESLTRGESDILYGMKSSEFFLQKYLLMALIKLNPAE